MDEVREYLRVLRKHKEEDQAQIKELEEWVASLKKGMEETDKLIAWWEKVY